MNPQETPTEPTPTPPVNEPTPAPTPVAVPAPVAPEQAPAAPATDQASVPTPPKKKFPTWLKVILIVLGVLIIGVVALIIFVMTATKGAETVTNQAVDNIQSGNTSALYAETSPAFRAATTEETLATLVDRVSSGLQGEESITARSINTINGTEYSKIVYSVKASDGSTKYIGFLLTKDASDWKIYNFRTSESEITLDSLQP